MEVSNNNEDAVNQEIFKKGEINRLWYQHIYNFKNYPIVLVVNTIEYKI